MDIIQVLTVKGQPVFECDIGWNPQDVDSAVESKYGQQQDGCPHNWERIPSHLVMHYYNSQTMAYTLCKALPNWVETTDAEDEVTCPKCRERLSGTER